MPAHKSSIFDLLNKDNLAIPDYQRPYKWTKRNIEELLTDISKAIEEGQKYGESYRYRIGTILIHNSQDGNLYIVDGQQRIISIALVCLYLLPSFHSDLTDHYCIPGEWKKSHSVVQHTTEAEHLAAILKFREKRKEAEKEASKEESKKSPNFANLLEPR